MSKELVNNPEHYVDKDGNTCIGKMQKRYGNLAVLIFCVLNAFKYNFRKGKKDGNPEALEKRKIHWYMNYANAIYHNELNFISRRIGKYILSKGID